MPPDGFEWDERKNGEIVIRHHGQTAATLRGLRAKEFRTELETADDQELMARLTGNYKRGNERWARNHPRNRTL